MFRKVLISGFAILVLAHAPGAGALALNDDGCSGCCQTKRSEESRSDRAKFCCLMNCSENGEKQSSTPAEMLTTERVNKRCLAATIALAADFTIRSIQPSYSSHTRVPRSIHIYLKTGNLLI